MHNNLKTIEAVIAKYNLVIVNGWLLWAPDGMAVDLGEILLRHGWVEEGYPLGTDSYDPTTIYKTPCGALYRVANPGQWEFPVDWDVLNP